MVRVTVAPPDCIEEIEMGLRPLTQTAERRAKELEMWDQILRTKEELMERGTMEDALLPDHCVRTEGIVIVAK